MGSGAGRGRGVDVPRPVLGSRADSAVVAGNCKQKETDGHCRQPTRTSHQTPDTSEWVDARGCRVRATSTTNAARRKCSCALLLADLSPAVVLPPIASAKRAHIPHFMSPVHSSSPRVILHEPVPGACCACGGGEAADAAVDVMAAAAAADVAAGGCSEKRMMRCCVKRPSRVCVRGSA